MTKINLNFRKQVAKRKLFYEISFVTGIVLLFISLHLASKTLIGFIIPTLIFSVFGLLAFFKEKKKYNQTYGYTGYAYALSHLTSSFGGFALFIFFALNFFIRTDKAKIDEYSITHRYSSFGGKGQRNILLPNFIIDYKNKDKTISFSKEFNDDIKLYKKVELKTSKGFFGFEILLKKNLKK